MPSTTAERHADQSANRLCGRSDIDSFSESLTGGLSCIFQPHAVANNQKILPKIKPDQFDAKPLDYVCRNSLLRAVKSGKFDEWEKVPEFKQFCVEKGFDPDQELSWIVYVDANSLYPTSMTAAPYERLRQGCGGRSVSGRCERPPAEIQP